MKKLKNITIVLLTAGIVSLVTILNKKNVANAYACDWGYKSTENCVWAWDCMTTKLCDCTTVTNAKEEGNNVDCINQQE